MRIKIIHLLSAAVFMVHAMNLSVIYSGYLLNLTYIKTQLCENRFTPQTNCEGKCYLSKEMKKGAAQEDTLPIKTKHQVENILFLPAGFSSVLLSPMTGQSTSWWFRKNYHFRMETSIFHPPRA
jgi:hypothetical protein